MTVIDIHAHAVLEAGFGKAGRYGPDLAEDGEGVPYFRIGEYEMKPMPYRGSLFMDVDRRLRAMDRDGIDIQLLSPNPLTMFHGIEPGIAAVGTLEDGKYADLVIVDGDPLADVKVLQDHSRIAGVMKGGQLYRGLTRRDPYVVDLPGLEQLLT